MNEYEAVILTALCFEPKSREKILSSLQINDFEDSTYKHLYSVCQTAWNNKLSLDDPGIQSQLIPHTLANSSLMWWTCVDLILESRYLTTVYNRCRSICEFIMSRQAGAVAIRNKIIELIEVESAQTSELQIPSIRESTQLLLAKIQNNNYHYESWAVDSLNKARLYPSTLTVVGARPRVGKTAFCTSIMHKQAKLGGVPGLICFEMSNEEILTRLLCQLTGMDFNTIRDGDFCNETRQESFKSSLDWLNRSNILLNCGKYLSLSDIEEVASMWVKEQGLTVLYIDYLQDIELRGQYESHRLMIGDICKRIKALARKLKIPIVLCAQLNRDAENAAPHLGHLAESSIIERQADMILILDRKLPDLPFRRHYQMDGRDITMDNRAAVIIAKNRNGPGGVVVLDFDDTSMEFSEINSRTYVNDKDVPDINY